MGTLIAKYLKIQMSLVACISNKLQSLVTEKVKCDAVDIERSGAELRTNKRSNAYYSHHSDDGMAVYKNVQIH